MLVLITDRRLIAHTLTDTLSGHGIYLYRVPSETALFTCDKKDTGGVILDCVPNLTVGEALCMQLRNLYPQIPIAAIVPRDSIPNLPADRILRDGDLNVICTDALDFCQSCGWSERPFSVYDLVVGLDPNETFYMGYPLHLSAREHTILRCIFYRSPETTSPDDLMSLCYPNERCNISNVAVMIHHINRRAAAIDPRPLIVNIYGKGYRLRDGILE